jgi:Tetratricopeptide repeat
MAIAACLVVSPAAAQPTAGKASALERFDEAQKLFDRGKHEDALALFRKVYDETKSPNARLMAARCLLALGRTADGYDELAATVREAAGRAESEPKYARTRDAAAAELGALEPKIGKIVVALADPGATVTLNGAKLAPERLGVPMATLPGRVVLLAKKPDGTTVQREETVGAGETKTITLVFPSAPTAAPAPPLPASPPPAIPKEPPPTMKTGGGVRVAGIVLATLGAAGMGVFGATYAVAQSKYNSLVSGCGGVRCTDPKYDSVIDSGKQMELASNVSVVAGGVALGAGVLMIIFGGPSAKPAPTTGAWSGPSLTLSSHGATIGYQGAF